MLEMLFEAVIGYRSMMIFQINGFERYIGGETSPP